jgi:hypothetical protein
LWPLSATAAQAETERAASPAEPRGRQTLRCGDESGTAANEEQKRRPESVTSPGLEISGETRQEQNEPQTDRALCERDRNPAALAERERRNSQRGPSRGQRTGRPGCRSKIERRKSSCALESKMENEVLCRCQTENARTRSGRWPLLLLKLGLENESAVEQISSRSARPEKKTGKHKQKENTQIYEQPKIKMQKEIFFN